MKNVARLPLRVVVVLVFSVLFRSPASTAEEENGIRRYLYLTSPDGAQQEGNSGTAILIFDIANGHRFVRRIEMPVFKEGLRGFTGSLANKCVYYSTTNRRLGSFHLEKEEVLWDRQYDTGCDRTCITKDGKTLYAPTGWWWEGPDSGFLMIDASNGELIRKIPVNAKAHNSIASLDGKHVFLGTNTTLTMFNAADGSVVRTISPVGEYGVFPYCIDSQTKFAYVCLGKHVGFDVVDLRKSEPIHRVFAGEEPIPHRTHGAGMTPDEKELWISDQEGKKLFIFDLQSMPPSAKGHVDLSIGGHGWVCFSLDGKYAWCHTPDVFDAATKEKVATLKDENGRPVAGSKFIEVHFRGDEVVRVGNEFGLGRLHTQREE